MVDKVTYTSNLDYDGKQKHILIFLDGTWNDEDGAGGDGVVTNIYKLFDAISGLPEVGHPIVKSSKGQVALYFRGVGNDEDNSVLGTFYEGAFGAGERRIRDNAYCELLKHYNSGDRISIFGFSRGAACARLLASKIDEYGILSSVQIYSKKRKNGNVVENYFLKYKKIDETARKVDVEFLGIFDTVGAFGIPINIAGIPFQKLNLFRNLKVAGNIAQVVHCVGIDESREPFIPTLCDNAANIDEVWFAGVHADVGGGYRYAELGKIVLNYLVERINVHFGDSGIRFKPATLKKYTDYTLTGENVRMHYHGDGVKKHPREIYVSKRGKKSKQFPKVHESVFQLMGYDAISVAEAFSSFTKVTPIIYRPESLVQLGDQLVTVKSISKPICN
jgi:uncharacterized protein (DUF2235 family)